MNSIYDRYTLGISKVNIRYISSVDLPNLYNPKDFLAGIFLVCQAQSKE